MNISLTTQCNNNCPYCFQKELHKNKNEFTLEDLERVLQWGAEDLTQWQHGISLLGGEPTLFPQLIPAIKLIYKYLPQVDLTLITNLLCEPELINNLQQFSNLTYLINTTHRKQDDNLFYQNLKRLTPQHQNICLSITLTDNVDLNQTYVNHLNDLLKEFPTITRVRLGLMQPAPEDAWVNIYNYEADIDYFLQTININNLSVLQFDCPVNYCQMSHEYYLKLIQFPCVKGLGRICQGPPFDIQPDLSVKYCYSSPDSFSINNIFAFNSRRQLENYFIEKSKDNYLIHNHKCKTCQLYLTNKCKPCHSIDHALLRGEGNIE